MARAARSSELRWKLLAWCCIASLGFGALTAHPELDRGAGAHLASALLRAIVWGLLTVPATYGILRWFDKRARSRQGQPGKAFWEPPTADHVVVVPLGRDEAFDRMLQAISELPRSTVTKTDRRTGVLEGRIGVTWKSWGERISVQVHSAGPTEASVSMSSRPAFPLTIMDYGKNRANVDALLSAASRLNGPSQ